VDLVSGYHNGKIVVERQVYNMSRYLPQSIDMARWSGMEHRKSNVSVRRRMKNGAILKGKEGGDRFTPTGGIIREILEVFFDLDRTAIRRWQLVPAKAMLHYMRGMYYLASAMKMVNAAPVYLAVPLVTGLPDTKHTVVIGDKG